MTLDFNDEMQRLLIIVSWVHIVFGTKYLLPKAEATVRYSALTLVIGCGVSSFTALSIGINIYYLYLGRVSAKLEPRG